MKNIAIVAMDPDNVPFVNGKETIFNFANKKVWYTPNTKIIEAPKKIIVADYLLNALIKKFLKRSKRRDLFRFSYFTKQVAQALEQGNYDEVIFENDCLKNKVLRPKKDHSQFIGKVSII